MTYFLDEIKDNYVTQKGGFKHTTPERAVLFPYITTPPSKSILNELKNFHGICGEVVRQLRGIKPTELFNNELFLKKIQNKFDFDKPEDGLQLQKILLKTIFTRDKELHCFHPKIFYYKSSKDSGTQKNLKSIGGFLASVFFTKNPDLLTDYRDITVENVFHDLILNSLPPLEESPNLISKKNFLKIDVGINECFLKDLKLITDNPKLSTKFLPELIKFYYLMYQLRLIEKLNYLFEIGRAHV